MKNNPLNFSDIQHHFAAYIRNPKNNPVPVGIAEQRMAVYHELFFNNIDSFLSNNFPVIRQILSDEQWYDLTRDFFARHENSTPYFTEIPEEFLTFLAEERNNADDLPFLLELAHYEWVEMALSIAKEELPEQQVAISDLASANIQLSPLALPLIYQYPVHQISPNFLPTEPPETVTCLVMYRDANDDIHFMHITPMTYQLLAVLQEQQTMSVDDCLSAITEQLSLSDVEAVKQAGLDVLLDLAAKQVVIGVSR